jgi:hypothetical protein
VAVGAAATETGWGSPGFGADDDKSEAPHMPQKRFSSEFSLPQRVQRNLSPQPIAYDILQVRCRMVVGQFGEFMYRRPCFAFFAINLFDR